MGRGGAFCEMPSKHAARPGPGTCWPAWSFRVGGCGSPPSGCCWGGRVFGEEEEGGVGGGWCPGPPRARPHPAHSGRAWLWDFQLRGPGLLVDYTTEEIPHTPACGTAHSEASSTSPGLPTSVQLPASTPPPPTPLHTWGPQMVQRQNPPAKGLCVLFPGLFLPTMTEGKGATEGVG